MANYNKVRAMKQVIATGLKAKKLAVGTELSVESVTEQDPIIVNGVERFRDFALCNSKDGQVRIPMNEFLRFKTKDGKPVYQAEDAAENIKLPSTLKIESSTDRKDRVGNTIYPLQAYKLSQELVDGTKTWEECVAAGLKPGVTFDAVQDYIVSI